MLEEKQRRIQKFSFPKMFASQLIHGLETHELIVMQFQFKIDLVLHSVSLGAQINTFPYGKQIW